MHEAWSSDILASLEEYERYTENEKEVKASKHKRKDLCKCEYEYE